MGIFDKIKQAKNFITGGGATVGVELGEANLGQPIDIRVAVKVKDADIKARNIYVKIRAVEEVIARDVDHMRDEGGSIRTYQEDVRNTATTFETEMEIAGEQVLESNQEYVFEGTVELPEDLNGTYKGANAWHIYSVYAGVDCAGNDPDSGWVEFDIY